MNTLKTVFIDWNGTLSTSSFWEHLQQPNHYLNHYSSIIDASIFKSKSPLRHLLNPWMRGQLSSEEVINTLAKESKLDQKILLKEFIYSCQNMKFISKRIPKLIKDIRAKNIKVVIATDNMDSFNRWTIPAMQLKEQFDNVLNSYYLGALKNDVDSSGRSIFFREFVDKYDLNQGQSILIDDSKHNGSAAQSLGISYHQIPFGRGLITKLEEINENT